MMDSVQRFTISEISLRITRNKRTLRKNKKAHHKPLASPDPLGQESPIHHGCGTHHVITEKTHSSKPCSSHIHRKSQQKVNVVCHLGAVFRKIIIASLHGFDSEDFVLAFTVECPSWYHREKRLMTDHLKQLDICFNDSDT